MKTHRIITTISLVMSMLFAYSGALLDDLRNPPFHATSNVSYCFAAVFGFAALTSGISLMIQAEDKDKS